MSSVYSHRFIAKQGLSGTQTFLVPEGFVAVARCLDSYADVLGETDLFFHGPVGETIWWFHWSPTDRKPAQWQGRQVFVAGEIIGVEVDAAPADGVDVTLSGYLLGE